ncbi:MAG: tetratricopeptide repeat protein [Verrucomicrobiia bacterium]
MRRTWASNPAHEDSRYYLGLCLASEGRTERALAQLRELQRINPQSHRAWQQWGVLRASSSREPADLESAQGALERAHAINPEETGALLVLGEIALLRANAAEAAKHLSAACQTNPKAVGGFFLSAYIAWQNGDDAAAGRLLEGARAALGPDWQPRGATSEGDVQRKQHVEITLLARFWEEWDGATSPAQSLSALHTYLTQR